MKRLYRLEFFSLKEDRRKERLLIGVFSGYSKADQTAKFLLRNTKSFSDDPYDYMITHKSIHGDLKDIRQVYQIESDHVDEMPDKADVYRSDYFTNKTDAENELSRMKASVSGSQWTLNSYIIDAVIASERIVK